MDSSWLSVLMDLYNIGGVILESMNEFNKMVEKFNLIVPVLSQQKPFTSRKHHCQNIARYPIATYSF